MCAWDYIAVFVLCLLSSVSVASVEFNVKASPAELEVGDTLTVDVLITFPEGDTLYDIAEVPVPAVKGFGTLYTASSRERAYVGGSYRYVMATRYLMEAVDTGRTSVPEMTLDYVDRRSGLLTSLASQRVVLHVSGKPSSVRPILLLFGGILFAGAAVVMAAVLVRRKRQRVDEAAEAASGIDPRAEFRRALTRAEVVLAHGRSAEAQGILFESLKQYLKAAYGIEYQSEGPSSASDLLQLPIPTELSEGCRRLDAWSDDLRYGGTARSVRELGALCERLRSLLEQ